MKVQIRDIATILSGVYLKNYSDPDVLYLQVKDFNASGEAYNNIEPIIKGNAKISKHLLTDKDLLFAAKGTTNFCAIYSGEMGEAVASSSFLVIKIMDRNAVLPEYIRWYLNLSTTMQVLKSNAVGSSIPSITKPMIEEIEIEIPTMKRQRLIIEIDKLQRKEQELHTQIAQQRKILTDKLLTNAIKEQ